MFNLVRFVSGAVIFLLTATKLSVLPGSPVEVVEVGEIALMLVALSLLSGKEFFARVVFSLAGFSGALGLARMASEYGHSVMRGTAYNISFRGNLLPALVYVLLILVFVAWAKYIKDKQ